MGTRKCHRCTLAPETGFLRQFWDLNRDLGKKPGFYPHGKFVRNPAADVTLWRISASRLRAFTPREYARLQTFPDDWVFLGGNKRDIQQQIGNAVPVQFARKLARNVRIALAALDQREAFFDDMAEGNLLLF